MNIPSAPLLAALLLLGGPAAPSPAQDEEASVDVLITRGRSLLDEGQAAQAEELFQRAVEAQDGLATRTWLLRSWIDQDRVHEALEEAEGLSQAGEEGPGLDYVYGMAFHRLARAEAAAGGTGSTGFYFNDSVEYLKGATAAEPTLFGDGFLALAEAAWYSGQLELAGTAIERAVGRAPRDPNAQLLQGRVALSRYSDLRLDEERAEERQRHWRTAVGSFQRSARLMGRPRAQEEQRVLADVYTQLGYAYVWEATVDELPAEALEAFRMAMVWAPEGVDFNYVWGLVGKEDYPALLERAREDYLRCHTDGQLGDALLSWWHGYALFAKKSRKNHEEAQKSFLAALERNPEYKSSWYYLAHARSTVQDWGGVLEALRAYWDLDPNELVVSLQSDAEATRRMVYNAISYWCMDTEVHGERVDNLSAVFALEVLTRVSPELDGAWSDLGLFRRDAGESLVVEGNPAAVALRKELFEGSLKAYERALELSPEDPNYLNDTAVILQYNLERDLERAEELYRRALELATLELEREDLGADQRENFETVRRDAQTNLARLRRTREG